MQPECLLKCWVSITCSLEHFYLQAVIPLISITLKSSFYDAAQVSNSLSFQSSFSEGVVKLKHNYRTFGGDSKVLWYFYFNVPEKWGKISSLWGNECQLSLQAVTTSFLWMPHLYGIRSGEINFKKVYLLRESYNFCMSFPISECRAQTFVYSSIWSGALGLESSLAWNFSLCYCLHDFNPEHLEKALCGGGSSLKVESCKDLK